MRLRGPLRTHTDWNAVLDRMIEEVRVSEPRSDAYWAQQLAFGPVLVHALALRVRSGRIVERDRESVGRVLRTAIRLLSALPEPTGGDPAALRILASRQASALATGRRTLLLRIARRLGADDGGPIDDPVPSHLLRCYRILT